MKICAIVGCETKVHSRGLCEKHYRRVLKTGVADEKVAGRGSREKHPLYGTWCRVRRNSTICGEWKEFWTFVKDVEQSYEVEHVLVKIDKLLPFSPTNFAWKKKLSRDYLNTEEGKAVKSEYARNWRQNNPARTKELDLQKSFGISLNYYKHLLQKQNGVCAICGKQEVVKDEKGIIRSLAVDHCHTTMEVRGLLCTKCNQGIGSFLDNVELLKSAIEYLQNFKPVTLEDL